MLSLLNLLSAPSQEYTKSGVPYAILARKLLRVHSLSGTTSCTQIEFPGEVRQVKDYSKCYGGYFSPMRWGGVKLRTSDQEEALRGWTSRFLEKVARLTDASTYELLSPKPVLSPPPWLISCAGGPLMNLSGELTPFWETGKRKKVPWIMGSWTDRPKP